MAEEIQEAIQIIRVAYEGIEIALKVGSGGIAVMQKAVSFLKGMLDYEKTLGKTTMKRLLMRGGDLQVLQFQTSDMKKVKRLAKKYGILYSVLPDINKDGLSEVIFHTEAVPRANMLIQKMGSGRIATFEDFLKDGDEKSLAKLMDFFQKQGNDKVHTEEEQKAISLMNDLIEKVGLFAVEKQSISVDAVKENFNLESVQAEEIVKQLETMGVLDKQDKLGNRKVILDQNAFLKRLNNYQELADRIHTISSSKNINLLDVTISRTLIVEENEHAIKTRVPGTWGKDVRYIWLKKDNIIDIYQGKSMLTFLDRNKDYKLYDMKNRVIQVIKGEELYENHYDKVEASVREHYEKAERTYQGRQKTVSHSYGRKKR